MGSVTPARRVRRHGARPLPQREGLDAVRVVCRPDDVGRPIIQVLRTRFPALESPAARPLAQRFRAGDFVDGEGKAWRPTDAAERSREVFFYRECAPEVVPEVHIPVVFEDEHLLVVDKPRGLASIPRGEHIRRSALVRLRVATGLSELSPIHRLDKQTGGLLVLSKKAEERGAYQSLFARGEVDKRYVAVVDTAPPFAELAIFRGFRQPKSGKLPIHALREGPLTIEAPILKNHGDLWAHVDPRGKDARTEVTLLRELGEGRAAVALRLFTGRTHQLRLHLSHVGLPIVGDELYPAPEPDPHTGERTMREVSEDGLHLWCTFMAFTDPLTGEQREFRVPDPVAAVA